MREGIRGGIAAGTGTTEGENLKIWTFRLISCLFISASINQFYLGFSRRRYSSTSSESSSDSEGGHRHKRQKKQSEVERLAEIERLR